MVWQYILYFFLYAALGWAAEVCYAAWKEHRLVNRGFLNGPLCPVYGFGMAAMLLLLAPWQGNVLAVFAGGMAITTLIEWLAGCCTSCSAPAGGTTATCRSTLGALSACPSRFCGARQAW